MLNVAVIGTGNWGRNLVRNFNALEQSRVSHICDLDPDTRQRMARLYPAAEVVSDYRSVLADRAVDAVVVAVEGARHYAIARASLEARRHTFVEKPITLSTSEAEDLADLADQRRVQLMVGHLLKYHPAVEYIKQMVLSGEVGRPLYMYSRRGNLGVDSQGENCWWDLGPHDICLACHFFDAEPVCISATGHAFMRPGVEDVVFANLAFADGRMAHIHVSWVDPRKSRKATLVGSRRLVAFDDQEDTDKVRIYPRGGGRGKGLAGLVTQGEPMLIPRMPGFEPLNRECQHFVDCIESHSRPLSDGREGVRVVRVLEAGHLSMARGGAPVEI